MLPGLTHSLFGAARTPISVAAVTPVAQNWPSTPPYEVNASVSHDGIGPFTYAWTATPSAGTTISNPSNQTITVSRANNTTLVTLNCTVTDLGPGGGPLAASPGTIEPAV